MSHFISVNYCILYFWPNRGKKICSDIYKSTYHSKLLPGTYPNSFTYQVYYFGIAPDTLDISPLGFIYMSEEWRPCAQCEHRKGNEFRNPKPGDLSIEIMLKDTVYIEGSILGYGNDSMTFYPAFPVLIVNHSADTLVVGNGNDLSLIVQEKTMAGDWEDIGVSNFESTDVLALPGRQIAISVHFFFRRRQSQILRFRIGDSFSEMFIE